MSRPNYSFFVLRRRRSSSCVSGGSETRWNGFLDLGALSYAFDFEWSNKNLFYGQYKRTNSYFENSELASKGLPSQEELDILEPLRKDLPKEVFTKSFRAPITDGSGNIRNQLRAASKLLKDAGWEIKNGKKKWKVQLVREFIHVCETKICLDSLKFESQHARK